MIIALLGLAGLLGMFLYQNLYQTITQSEEIVILKQEIAPDTINVKKVEELIDRIEQKKAGQEDIDWSQIKNSFAPAAADIEPAPENLTQE